MPSFNFFVEGGRERGLIRSGGGGGLIDKSTSRREAYREAGIIRAFTISGKIEAKYHLTFKGGSNTSNFGRD